MTTQRVVEADVRAIFPTFPADISLQPFIETAAMIVTERLVGHYTDARLFEIERWLAAHLASQFSGGSGGAGQISEMRAEEITIRYSTAVADSPENRFTAHLRLLDYKGILESDQKSTVARFVVH